MDRCPMTPGSAPPRGVARAARRALGALLALVAGVLAPARPAAGEEDPHRAAEQAELQRMVDALRPVVARLRGLAWKHEVPAAVMSRAEVEAFMLAELDEELPPAKRALAVRILNRHHLLRPGEDPVAMQIEAMREMVAGFYDPDTKRFYVVEGMTGHGMKPTIVHELVHALEDQHFDLEAIEKPYRETDPDRSFAIRCVWEGSAEWVRRRYQIEDAAVDGEYYRQQMEGAEEQARTQVRLLTERIPAYMVLSTLLHYRVGPHFILEAVGDDLPGGIARVLADPPTTQEQVLYPHRWLGPERDHPRRVIWAPDFDPARAKRGRVLFRGTVGELDLATFLDYFVGDNDGRLTEAGIAAGRYVAAEAREAAQGWDAGEAVYLELDGGRVLVAQALAFDREEDAVEAAGTLWRALTLAYADSLVRPGGPGAEPPDFAAAPETSALLASEHGVARILRRGREVLWLDGGTAAEHAEFWPALAATRFEADPRDRGDGTTAAAAFAGCDVVDLERGVGLVLPAGEWTALEDPAEGVFAHLRGAAMEVEVRVADQAATPAGITHVFQQALGPMFRAEGQEPIASRFGPGLRYDLPGGQGVSLFAVSDAARLYVAVVRQTAPVERAALAAAVDRLFAGLRSVPSY